RCIDAGAEVVNGIVASRGKATALRADISDEAQVMAMFEAIDRMGEPRTALVNKAGILYTQYTVESLSDERINGVLA
ncbi:NAD(P)-dependent oxidoreductase, partial [Klebsiella pneumoniae]|nr:NAD(P)-dependent oxidoreductase [Klebsiella pneumoniae]